VGETPARIAGALLTRADRERYLDGARTADMQNATRSSATARAMTITIFVPGLLRHCCDGASELTMPAASVRVAFEQLERRYPSLYRSVCDETGAVRRHMNIFVNTSNTRDGDGLDTALIAGDVVTILPAVSGG
jgi:sulfur-carrier protein